MSHTTLQKQLHDGMLRHQRGDISGAAGIYAQILKSDPRNADAWHLTGLVAFQQNQHSEAETCIRKALTLVPAQADFMSNLASVMLALHREAEAEAICRDIISQHPTHAGAWKRLGDSLSKQDKLEEAEVALRQAATLRPQDSQTLCNLGAALVELRRLDDAKAVLTEARRLDPSLMHVHLNLGVAERECGNLDAALDSLTQAIKLGPNTAEAYLNRGNALLDKGEVTAALRDFQQAVNLNPQLAAGLNGLGRALQLLGHWGQAKDAFDLACTLDAPGLRFESDCLYFSSLCPDISRRQLFELHQSWGQRIEQQTPVLPATTARQQGKLRIGYLSPDFYAHATMRFFVPLLQNHDHSNCEIFCYSESYRSDAVTQQVQHYSDHWRSTLGLTDEALANLIRQDEIDVLVDLAGHTAGNRLTAMARRPAPVQVSFLGYPTTTGLSRIDYFLTDSVRESSAGDASYFTEQLEYLPHGACCFQAGNESIPVSELPALHNGYITLGSTHRLEKMSPQCLELWSRVLQALPTSRLFIVRDVLRSEMVRNTLSQQLSSAGIPLDRVDLAWELPESHLTLYSHIDILLDVFPWGSGTTAYESMWMGVPVPTVMGDRGGCRATASMMHFCGLPELVALSFAEYPSLVAELSSDLTALTKLRRTSRQRMQETVCNGQQFARDIEAAFFRMCNRQPDVTPTVSTGQRGEQ